MIGRWQRRCLLHWRVWRSLCQEYSHQILAVWKGIATVGEGVLCCVCLKYKQLMGNALTNVDFYYTENSMYRHLALSITAAVDTDRNMHAFQLAGYM